MQMAAVTLVSALLVAGCGSTQGKESGPVSTETVNQLEDLMHARATAMGKGDRDGFLATIDSTRPAFRRIQLREFDYPSVRGTLASTFKISAAERYGTYIRGFVEETLEGNAFAGAFNGGRAYYRHYFRNDGGKWLLTEPTGEETGSLRKKSSGDVAIGYWALDEDVSDVLLTALEDARRYAQGHAPKPVLAPMAVEFVPTAELAGPGWDGFRADKGVIGQISLLPWWWAFDATRTHVSAYTEMELRAQALDVVRESVAPGIQARLLSEEWLNAGWIYFATGLDVTGIVRQSCSGIAIPTLRELGAGFPPFGTPGVAPDAYGRFQGYASSMVAYLHERHGPDAYWRLMAAYAQSASAAVNFPKVIQTTPDDFYAAWLVWLKKKYC